MSQEPGAATGEHRCPWSGLGQLGIRLGPEAQNREVRG